MVLEYVYVYVYDVRTCRYYVHRDSQFFLVHSCHRSLLAVSDVRDGQLGIYINSHIASAPRVWAT